MREIRIDGALPVNIRLLDEQMRAGLARYAGLATDSALRVFLEDGAPQSDEARARAIAAAHDHTQLSKPEAAEKGLVDFILGLNLQNELATIDAIGDLASAKTYLKRLVRGLIHLARLMGYAVVLEEA